MNTRKPADSAVALLHADGTECHHPGNAQATVHDDGGPVCPAGQPVTHIRYNGRYLTIADAYAALSSMAETITKAIAPVAAAFVEFARTVGNDPHVRALAAASEVVQEASEQPRG